jgi:hypothetical protein
MSKGYYKRGHTQGVETGHLDAASHQTNQKFKNTQFIDKKIWSVLCDLTLGQIRLKSANG